MSHLGVMGFFHFSNLCLFLYFLPGTGIHPNLCVCVCVCDIIEDDMYVKPSQKKRVQYEKKSPFGIYEASNFHHLSGFCWFSKNLPFHWAFRNEGHESCRGSHLGSFLAAPTAAIPTKRAPETNMDTNNDGMEKDSPSSYGEFWCSNLLLWRLSETLYQA